MRTETANSALYFLGLIVILTSLAACDLLKKPKEKVLLKVGAREVTVGEFRQEIKRVTSGMGLTNADMKTALKPLTVKIIEQYLILEYGREKQTVVTESELNSAIKKIKSDYSNEDFEEMLLRKYVDFDDWKAQLERSLLIEKILHSVCEDIPPVTYDEIKSYFESHQKDFSKPDQARFRQIVCRKKEVANALMKRLKDGESMENILRDPGVQGQFESGGETEWVCRDDLDESLGKAVFALHVGQRTPIIETPYGYHIIELIDLRLAGQRALPEVMKEIKAALGQKKKEAYLENWMKKIRSRFPIEINHKTLESMELG